MTSTSRTRGGFRVAERGLGKRHGVGGDYPAKHEGGLEPTEGRGAPAHARLSTIGDLEQRDQTLLLGAGLIPVAGPAGPVQLDETLGVDVPEPGHGTTGPDLHGAVDDEL